MFKDFQLDTDGDLLIKNGDFVVSASDMQHVSDIIESFVGEWKQYPAVGVGIMTYLKSQNPQAAVNQIKTQLQSDGYVVGPVKVSITEGSLKVDFPNGSLQRNE